MLDEGGTLRVQHAMQIRSGNQPQIAADFSTPCSFGPPMVGADFLGRGCDEALFNEERGFSEKREAIH